MKERALIIENIIKKSREYYKKRWHLNSFKEINHGHCMYFAELVKDRLESEYSIKVEIVDSDTLKIDSNDGDNSPWDKDKFSKRNFRLHKNLSFEDLESAKFYYHVWVYDKETNKHYDSECPKGVGSVLSLPIYKRAIRNYGAKKEYDEAVTDLSELFDELFSEKA